MPNNEERILITKVSPHCHALRFSCDPFDTEEGMFCEKSGRYVRIAEKDCKKCKSPVLCGISRAEAVERMAEALFVMSKRVSGSPRGTWINFKKKYPDTGFYETAEAALDALLGGKND